MDLPDLVDRFCDAPIGNLHLPVAHSRQWLWLLPYLLTAEPGCQSYKSVITLISIRFFFCLECSRMLISFKNLKLRCALLGFLLSGNDLSGPLTVLSDCIHPAVSRYFYLAWPFGWNAPSVLCVGVDSSILIVFHLSSFRAERVKASCFPSQFF